MRVGLVDDEDVDDPRAQDAEDRERLLGLADDDHDGVDRLQLVEAEAHEPRRLRGLQAPAVDVDVVAEDVARRPRRRAGGGSPRARSSRCGPSCSRRPCRRSRRGRPTRRRPPRERLRDRRLAQELVAHPARSRRTPARRGPSPGRRSGPRGGGRSRSGWSASPRAASRPWRSRTSRRSGAGAEEARDLARVAAVADGDDGAVVEPCAPGTAPRRGRPPRAAPGGPAAPGRRSPRARPNCSRSSRSRSTWSQGGVAIRMSTTPVARARSSRRCTFGRDRPKRRASASCVRPSS